MYVGWLLDSNQNEGTVIADYEFNSARPQTPSYFHLQLYQEHTSINKIWGELDFWNHQKGRKQIRSKCHSKKLRTQPTKHYWKKHKNFKNAAYYLHTANTTYKIKLECTNRNEGNKT